jgi:hypothetical protein
MFQCRAVLIRRLAHPHLVVVEGRAAIAANILPKRGIEPPFGLATGITVPKLMGPDRGKPARGQRPPAGFLLPLCNLES